MYQITPEFKEGYENEEGQGRQTEAMQQALYVTGQRIRAMFDDAKRDRRATEQRWLEDLRQFKGLYSPEMRKLIPKNRSKAFVRITRRKVKIFDARMKELLFPSNAERNWDIEPTPKQTEQILQTPLGMARMQALQEQTQGQITPQMLEELQDEVAKEACEGMRTEIDDQLSEGNYRQICSTVIHSGNLFGTGVLKSPMVKNKVERTWQLDPQSQQWRLVRTERRVPFFEAVELWCYFPDMQAVNIEDCQYHFQLRVLNPQQLKDLARIPGFNKQVLMDYARQMPDGDAQLMEHRTELDALNSDQDTRRKQPLRLYDVIEGWVMMTEEDYIQMGFEPENVPEGVTWANVWMLGPYVIKAEAEPLEGIDHPFNLYYFDKDETSIFGEGLAAIMRDEQRQLNSIRRAALDNAASSVGNVYDVNVDLLLPTENSKDIYPGRVFLRGGNAHDPAVRIVSTPNHVNQYLALASYVEEGIHENTVPSYMHGGSDNGSGSTATGLSMLMGAANLDIKDQVRFFDDGITLPALKGIYHWNMIFSEKEEIKGDYNVKPRGSSSLVAKEIRVAQLDQAMGMFSNELFAPFIDYRKLAEQALIARDLGDTGIVMSEEDYQANMADKAKIQALEQQLAQKDAMMQLMRSVDADGYKALEVRLKEMIEEKSGRMAKQAVDQEVENGQL